MAPIRVALVGLNAPPAGTPSGTNWAANGHLPHLLNSDKYKLVALQNSSAERAAAAIKAYGLDAETKAYGSPEGTRCASHPAAAGARKHKLTLVSRRK